MGMDYLCKSKKHSDKIKGVDLLTKYVRLQDSDTPLRDTAIRQIEKFRAGRVV